jgi:hypothetical protein
MLWSCNCIVYCLWNILQRLIIITGVVSEGVSKSFRPGYLEWELQMVQLSATRCSCIAILWVSLMSFATITHCVASQWEFIVAHIYFIVTQFGNLWIHPHVTWDIYLPQILLGVGMWQLEVQHGTDSVLQESVNAGQNNPEYKRRLPFY